MSFAGTDLLTGGGGSAASGTAGIGAGLSTDSSSSATSSGGGLGESCAAVHAGSERSPLYLVVVMDASKSMGNNDPSTPKVSKYEASAQALIEFFSSASPSTSAALSFFCGNDCEVAAYEPLVPMTPLPNATPFTGPITNYQTCLGTPTRPALEAAYLYAQGIQAELKKASKPGKLAVVLASDGVPTTCQASGESNPATMTRLAGNALADHGISTYAIGINTPETQPTMVALAKAGGTGAPFVIRINEIAQGAAELTAALSEVVGLAVPCSFVIPPVPAGEVFDPQKTNVSLVEGGTTTLLAYSPDCTAPNGWQYDSATAPTQVNMCSQMCEKVKADVSLSVDLAFGCATVSVPPQ